MPEIFDTDPQLLQSLGESIKMSKNRDFSILPDVNTTDYLPNNSYDKNLGYGEDQRRNRAYNQGLFMEVFTKGVNLVPNMIAGGVEMVGYLGELPEILSGEADYKNGLIDSAKSWRNYAMGDVYGKNEGQTFDIGDSAWLVNNIGDLYESVGEFVAGGAAISAITGGLGTLPVLGMKFIGKGAKVANWLANSKVAAKGFNTATKLLNPANVASPSNIATAGLLSYVEGAMSGAEVYDKTYQEHLAKGMDSMNARKVASNAANVTTALNTAINLPLNILSSAMFFKTAAQIAQFNKAVGSIRVGDDIIDAATKGKTKAGTNLTNADIASGNTASKVKSALGEYKPQLVGLKELAIEGTQEAFEELNNVYAEGVGMDIGKTGATSFGANEILTAMLNVEDYLAKTMTEEGALSALLGAVGGVGQTLVVDLAQGLLGKEKAKEHYANLKNEYARQFEVFDEKTKTVNRLSEQLIQAKSDDERKPIETAIKKAKDELFISTALSSAMMNDSSDNLFNTFTQLYEVDNKENLLDVYINKASEINSTIQDLEVQKSKAAPLDKPQFDVSIAEQKKQLDSVVKEKQTAINKVKKGGVGVAEPTIITQAMVSGLATSPTDNRYKEEAQRLSNSIGKAKEQYTLFQNLYGDNTGQRPENNAYVVDLFKAKALADLKREKATENGEHIATYDAKIEIAKSKNNITEFLDAPTLKGLGFNEDEIKEVTKFQSANKAETLKANKEADLQKILEGIAPPVQMDSKLGETLSNLQEKYDTANDNFKKAEKAKDIDKTDTYAQQVADLSLKVEEAKLVFDKAAEEANKSRKTNESETNNAKTDFEKQFNEQLKALGDINYDKATLDSLNERIGVKFQNPTTQELYAKALEKESVEQEKIYQNLLNNRNAEIALRKTAIEEGKKAFQAVINKAKNDKFKETVKSKVTTPEEKQKKDEEVERQKQEFATRAEEINELLKDPNISSKDATNLKKELATIKLKEKEKAQAESEKSGAANVAKGKIPKLEEVVSMPIPQDSEESKATGQLNRNNALVDLAANMVQHKIESKLITPEQATKVAGLAKEIRAGDIAVSMKDGKVQLSVPFMAAPSMTKEQNELLAKADLSKEQKERINEFNAFEVEVSTINRDTTLTDEQKIAKKEALKKDATFARLVKDNPDILSPEGIVKHFDKGNIISVPLNDLQHRELPKTVNFTGTNKKQYKTTLNPNTNRYVVEGAPTGTPEFPYAVLKAKYGAVGSHFGNTTGDLLDVAESMAKGKKKGLIAFFKTLFADSLGDKFGLDDTKTTLAHRDGKFVASSSFSEFKQQNYEGRTIKPNDDFIVDMLIHEFGHKATIKSFSEKRNSEESKQITELYQKVRQAVSQLDIHTKDGKKLKLDEITGLKPDVELIVTIPKLGTKGKQTGSEEIKATVIAGDFNNLFQNNTEEYRVKEMLAEIFRHDFLNTLLNNIPYDSKGETVLVKLFDIILDLLGLKGKINEKSALYETFRLVSNVAGKLYETQVAKYVEEMPPISGTEVDEEIFEEDEIDKKYLTDSDMPEITGLKVRLNVNKKLTSDKDYFEALNKIKEFLLSYFGDSITETRDYPNEQGAFAVWDKEGTNIFKILHGGDRYDKDTTIYVGDYATALKLAKAVEKNKELQKYLDSSKEGQDEVLVSRFVSGRAEVGKTYSMINQLTNIVAGKSNFWNYIKRVHPEFVITTKDKTFDFESENFIVVPQDKKSSLVDEYVIIDKRTNKMISYGGMNTKEDEKLAHEALREFAPELVMDVSKSPKDKKEPKAEEKGKKEPVRVAEFVNDPASYDKVVEAIKLLTAMNTTGEFTETIKILKELLQDDPSATNWDVDFPIDLFIAANAATGGLLGGIDTKTKSDKKGDYYVANKLYKPTDPRREASDRNYHKFMEGLNGTEPVTLTLASEEEVENNGFSFTIGKGKNAKKVGQLGTYEGGKKRNVVLKISQGGKFAFFPITGKDGIKAFGNTIAPNVQIGISEISTGKWVTDGVFKPLSEILEDFDAVSATSFIYFPKEKGIDFEYKKITDANGLVFSEEVESGFAYIRYKNKLMNVYADKLTPEDLEAIATITDELVAEADTKVPKAQSKAKTARMTAIRNKLHQYVAVFKYQQSQIEIDKKGYIDYTDDTGEQITFVDGTAFANYLKSQEKRRNITSENLKSLYEAGRLLSNVAKKGNSQIRNRKVYSTFLAVESKVDNNNNTDIDEIEETIPTPTPPVEENGNTFPKKDRRSVFNQFPIVVEPSKDKEIPKSLKPPVLQLAESLGGTKYVEMIRNSLDNIILSKYLKHAMISIDTLIENKNGEVEKAFEFARKYIIDTIKARWERDGESVDGTKEAELDDKLATVVDKENYSNYIEDHKRHLKAKYGISLKNHRVGTKDDEDKVSTANEEYSKVDNIINDKASHEEDNVTNLSTTTRILIATIEKKTKQEEGWVTALNEFGLPENHDFTDVYNYLILKLKDTPQDKIFTKLQDLGKSSYFAQDIYNLLTNNGLSINTPQMQYAINNFIRDFNKMSINHRKVLLRGDGGISTSSNMNNLNDNHVLDIFAGNSLRLTNGAQSNVDGEVDYEVHFSKDDDDFTQLKKLGIPLEIVAQMAEQVQFLGEVNSVVKYLVDEIQKDKLTIPLRASMESAYINNKFRNIIDIFQKYAPETVSNQFLGIGNKSLYGISQTSYASQLVNELNNAKSIEELFERNPELNNLFTDESIILKRIKNGTLKRGDIVIDTLNGLGLDTINADEAETKDSHYTERLIADMNMFWNNNTLLTPTHSSKSTNYTMGIKGDPYVRDMVDFKKQVGLYYDAEMKLKAVFNNTEVAAFLSNFKNIGKNGGDFRMFDKIKGKNKEEIVNNYIEQVQGDIKAFTDNLDSFGLLQKVQKKNKKKQTVITFTGINKRVTDEAGIIDKAGANKLVEKYYLNRIINNYEMGMLFYGDPANFKKNEIFKRIYAAFSTKDFMRDDSQWIDFVKANRTSGKDIAGRYSENAVQVTGKNVEFLASNLKTMVLRDAEFETANIQRTIADAQAIIDSEDMELISTLPLDEKVRAKLINAYNKNKSVNQTDAYAIARFATYRDILERTTGWTAAQEAGYQAYIKGEEMPEDAIYSPIKVATFQNESMGKAFQDIIAELKLGDEAKAILDRLSMVTLHKYAISPGIKSFYTGTKMEKVIERMDMEYVDYVTVESASKGESYVGNKADRENYPTMLDYGMGNGNAVHQWTAVKGIGVQVNTKAKVGNEVTNITQAMKMLFIDQMDAEGNFVNNETAGRFKELNQGYFDMFSAGVTSVTADMGMKLVGNTLVVIDANKLSNTLVDNFEGQVPNNILMQFSTGTVLNLDVSPNAEKIENIILSMISKALIKHKWTGENYTQVTGYGFMDATDNSNPMKTSSLKHYRTINVAKRVEGKILKDENGNTVMTKKVLPAQVAVALTKDMKLFMKDKGIKTLEELNKLVKNALDEQEDNTIEGQENTDLYKEILKLITMTGGRIPVQHYNSMDVVQIAKFLPINAGKTIVLPPEFTFKSGGDFDYDKLTLYRYKYVPLSRDKEGNVRVIIRNGKEITTRRRASEKKKIQNRIIDVMSEQILAPHNFIRLTTPNDATELKDAAKSTELYKKLQPVESLANMYSPILNDKAFEEFVTGKRLTGIAALAQTHNQLSQIVKMWMKILDADGDYVGDINLHRIYNDDYQYISNIISQMIDASVDVEKDPYIFGLGITLENAGAFFFALRSGMGINAVVDLFTDPVVKEFEKLNIKYKTSLYAKMYQPRVNIDENIANKLSQFVKDNGHDTKNINKYKAYMEYARSLKDVMTATNHDTNGTAKNTVENALIQAHTNNMLGTEAKDSLFYSADKSIGEQLQENKLTGKIGLNVENAVRAIHSNTFIGTFYNGVIEANNMLTPLSRLSSKAFNDFLTGDIYNKVKGELRFNDEKTLTYLRKFKNDVILYLYQKRRLENSNEKEISVKMLHDRLFSLEGIQRIIDAKENPKTKDLRIIKDIQFYQHLTKKGAGASNQSYRYYKLANKRYNTPESDLITESWNELYNINQELALDIAAATMFQSGLNSTPISFTDKIPFELYNAMGNLFGDVTVEKLIDYLENIKYYEKFNANNLKTYFDSPPSIITKYDKDYVNAVRIKKEGQAETNDTFEVKELPEQSTQVDNTIEPETKSDTANQFPVFSEATLRVQKEKAEKQVKEC